MSNTGTATIMTTVSNLRSHIKVLNSQTAIAPNITSFSFMAISSIQTIFYLCSHFRSSNIRTKVIKSVVREIRTLFTLSPFYGGTVLAVVLLHYFQEDTIIQKHPAIYLFPFISTALHTGSKYLHTDSILGRIILVFSASRNVP
jgi:hypothetical protein